MHRVMPPRLALGDIVHKRFNIGPRQGRDRDCAEQRFNVTRNPHPIGDDRAGLLADLTARQNASGLGVGEVAQLSNAPGVTLGLFEGRRIETACDVSEQSLCLAACRVRCPW
jgi:hypothetical protein